MVTIMILLGAFFAGVSLCLIFMVWALFRENPPEILCKIGLTMMCISWTCGAAYALFLLAIETL